LINDNVATETLPQEFFGQKASFICPVILLLYHQTGIKIGSMKSFNITYRPVDGYDVLELHGELDAHTASVLEESLVEYINRHHYQIIVNFSDLDYIASAGLGVFMAYIEDVREQGGDIKLTDMNKKVYNVFDLLGFPALYDILDHEQEAVQKFNRSSSSSNS
jgi:anti-sigma B factor antagonist